MTLQERIAKLIESKREGSFWDFKKEPYTNNSDLLLDIICMANSLVKSDKYIIIGVTDPSLGCEVVGVARENSNRKTQNQYIDFIKSIEFAADRRPELELRTLILNEREVDVIVVFDKPEKPYYLSKDKDGLRANYIYTRIGDTNTPRVKSCDDGLIEKMWRERFGIDLTPKERMLKLLDLRKEWDVDPGNRKEAYCESFPEYTLKFSKTTQGWEPYSHYYPNPKSFFGKVKFKYFSTTLFTCEYVFLDEFRIALGVPEIGSIKKENKENYYYYYLRDSIQYKISRLLDLEHLAHYNPIYRPFLFFNDDEEHELFKKYILTNYEVIITEDDDSHDLHLVDRISKDGNSSGVDILMMGKIIRWYNKWRNERMTNLTIG